MKKLKNDVTDEMIEQIWTYGLFSEYLPKDFTTVGLLKNFKKLKQCNDKKWCKPCSFTIFKTEMVRREIKIPNVEVYFKLIETIIENWDQIKEKLKSSNSLSKIIIPVNEKEFFDIPSWRDQNLIKSTYNTWDEIRIKESMGAYCELKIDISNCYNSIYTHSIEWLFIGKKVAKTMKEENKKKIGAVLDELIRQMQDGQTIGIPTGPFASRIISELLLSQIDKELREAKFKFFRYVDDFSFYFRNDKEVEKSKEIIAKILRQYGFSINEAKVKLNKYPFEIKVDLKKELKLDYSEPDFRIRKAIAQCNKLREEKGSYKYLLKMLNNKKISKQEWIYLKSALLSILSIKPDLAQFVTQILINNKNKMGTVKERDEMKEVITDMIKANIESQKEHELIWLIWLAKKLELKLELATINEIIEKGNDIAKIIAMDIAINSLNYKNEVTFIEQMEKLENELEEYSITDERWLLLYTIVANNYSDNEQLKNNICKSQFFKKCLNLNIKFYVDAVESTKEVKADKKLVTV